MNEFSLESLSEKIYHYKTKDYFGEIISSYNNSNYRSASVMLWSVVIIDLVFKLKDLVDLHEDRSAKSILDQMSKAQARDRKNSSWEHILIKEISSRTRLLNSDNISFLEYLYQQRNLSAHPVLDENLELHRPNKDTIRALIVNTVEGVLSKPPFFSKDIVGSIVLDLEASKGYLEDDEDKLKHYLDNRFLSKMTEAVKLEVFKSLWKFVFKLENEKSKTNRKINFSALNYIYSKNKEKCLSLIDNESDYFSDISKRKLTISYLVDFLSFNPEIYRVLEKGATILVDNRTDKIGSSEEFVG